MRPRVLLRPLFEAQVVEIFNHLRLSSARRGPESLQAVDRTINALEHFSELYQIFFSDVRRARVEGFPYLLLYQLQENEAGQIEIVVAACVHQRSDPQKWCATN